MGKLYNNGLPVGTGLKIDNPSPVDDKMYVQTYADLATLANKYDGLITRVKDENFKAYIYRVETNSWQPYSDATTGPANALVSSGKVTQAANVYTYEANDAGVNYQWNIGGVPFLNTVSAITIPLAASGNHRVDITYVDASNGIKRRAGTEVLTSEQRFAPALLPNEILLNTFFINETTTSAPDPITTSDFIKKREKEQIYVTIASNKIDVLQASGGQTNFIITQANSTLHGLDNIFEQTDEEANFYIGKYTLIENQSGTNLTLSHLTGTAEAKFKFSNNVALVVPNNERALFELVDDGSGNMVLILIAKSFDTESTIIVTLEIGQTNVDTSAEWNNKLVKIVCGATNITLTVNHEITCEGTKEGTGNIQYVAGTKSLNSLNVPSALLAGRAGSTWAMTKNETVANQVHLYLNPL